jgi:hypothetical protein
LLVIVHTPRGIELHLFVFSLHPGEYSSICLLFSLHTGVYSFIWLLFTIHPWEYSFICLLITIHTGNTASFVS